MGYLDNHKYTTITCTRKLLFYELFRLGEAVKRLSEEFRSGHSTIPWRLIAGMRDKLIHGYDDVDLDEVWKAAEKDVPQLIQWIEPLLPSQEN